MNQQRDSSKEIVDHYKPIGLKAVAAAARLCTKDSQASSRPESARLSADLDLVRES